MILEQGARTDTCVRTLEGCHRDIRNEGVELVGGIFVLVPLTGQSNTHTEWHIPVGNTSGLTLQIVDLVGQISMKKENLL